MGEKSLPKKVNTSGCIFIRLETNKIRNRHPLGTHMSKLQLPKNVETEEMWGGVRTKKAGHDLKLKSGQQVHVIQ